MYIHYIRPANAGINKAILGHQLIKTIIMDSPVLPEPFASIPRESFLFGQSPIQHLENISKALGGKVDIYAKREDCNSGLAFGGNKTRKLE